MFLSPGDQSTFAPSFLKVLPNRTKNTSQNELINCRQSEPSSSSNRPMSNIPDPTGTRYSRRVRGLNDGVMYDSTVLEMIESSRRRNHKLQSAATKAATADEATPTEDTEELNETTSTVPNDNLNDSCCDVEMIVNNSINNAIAAIGDENVGEGAQISNHINPEGKNDGGKMNTETHGGVEVESQKNGEDDGLSDEGNDDHEVVNAYQDASSIIKVKRSLEFQDTEEKQSKGI